MVGITPLSLTKTHSYDFGIALDGTLGKINFRLKGVDRLSHLTADVGKWCWACPWDEENTDLFIGCPPLDIVYARYAFKLRRSHRVEVECVVHPTNQID